MSLSYSTKGHRSSPAILFLHGFMGSGADWDEVASDLSDEFFCVIPDLAGHGGSIGSEVGYTFPDTSAALIAILDELSVTESNIVGYSMGGRIALYVAMENPTRVRSLVLESSSPGLKTERERRERTRIDAERAGRLEQIGLARFVDEWYGMPMFSGMNRRASVYDELLARRKQNDVRGLVLSLRDAGTGVQPSLWNRLTELRLPVMLVTGSLDTKFEGIASEMAGNIRFCRQVSISNCGHNVHFERPRDFCGQLRQFASKQ